MAPNRDLTFACTGTTPTRRGVYAIYGGYEGYGWRCPHCPAVGDGYAACETEAGAAQARKRHMQRTHPEVTR